MKTNIVDTVCTRCWGRRKEVVRSGHGLHAYTKVVDCTRCKGTGEEPDTFPGWPVIIGLVLFAIIALFAIWGIPE